jgi:hypothetical protein
MVTTRVEFGVNRRWKSESLRSRTPESGIARVCGVERGCNLAAAFLLWAALAVKQPLDSPSDLVDPRSWGNGLGLGCLNWD